MAQYSLLKRKHAAEKPEQKLQELYEKQDYLAMIPLLEQLVQEDLGKTRLWKYRCYYRELPFELARNSPIICYGLAILAVLSDDIATADTYVTLLQKKQAVCRKSSPHYKELETCL